jgi:hypothetical protein
VRPDLGRAPWYAYPAGCTRLVGQRLTATGMWLKQPRNRNFAPEDDEEGGEEGEEGVEAEEEAEDEEDESDDGDGGEGEGEGEGEGDDDDEDDEDNGSKLRRAEFTLLGLDD